MSNTVYLLFTIGLFVVDFAALICLFVLKRRSEYLGTPVAGDEVREVPYWNMVQGVLFAAAATGLFVLAPDKVPYESVSGNVFGVLILFFALSGFVPRSSSLGRQAAFLLEFGALVSAVFMLPAPPFFQKIQAPLPVVKVGVAAVWMFLFKQCGFGGKRGGLVCAQTFFVGATFFAAVFLTHAPRALSEFGGIFLPLTAAAYCMTVLYNTDASLGKPLENVFNIAVTGMCFQLAEKGLGGCALLLLSYPLFELFFGAWRRFKNLFRRKEKRVPVFFYELLEARGFSESQIVAFVLRRDFLFGAMVLLTLDRAYIQPQMVVLAFVLYLKFAIGISNPDAGKATVRGLFKQIGADARKGWGEANEAYAVVKEKYKDSDKK
ncbi:MAG TPA: hypothetical protein DD624_01050 [Alphaproteobacteria bacterium]|nr:hypothetical protein [Alphaproteobacteria bacterium]